ASPEENLERMGRQGLDATLVIPFTLDFSHMEAEAFVADVLAARLRVKEVVVGYNHTFGRDARGTSALLQSLGTRHGFVTHVLPPLKVDGQTVSSSVIRESLRDGDPVRAPAASWAIPMRSAAPCCGARAGAARLASPPRTSVRTARCCSPPASTWRGRPSPAGAGGRGGTSGTGPRSVTTSTGSRPISWIFPATSTTGPSPWPSTSASAPR